MPTQKVLNKRETVDMLIREWRDDKGTRKVWQSFAEHPRIGENSKIVIWLCGGSAQMGDVIKAAQKKFPRLWEVVEVINIDYDIDPAHVDPSWMFFDIGKALKNMTLRQVLAKHKEVAKKELTSEEFSCLMEYVKKNGNHYYSDGAGANEYVGKLGILLARKAFQRFVVEYAMELKADVMSNNILNIIVDGSGGGTGKGIRDVVREQVDAAFRAGNLETVTGAIELVLAFRAYSFLVFANDGTTTQMGPKIWEDGIKDWRTRRNCFFLTTECGADGFLLLLTTLATASKILNNSPERDGHPNGLLQIAEITPWAIQRISAFELNRGNRNGKLPKLFKVHTWGRKWVEVIMDVSSMKTIGELARARYVLLNWQSELRLALGKAGLLAENVDNFDQISSLVGSEAAVLASMQSALLQESGSTGFYLHPSELELLPLIHELKYQKVLYGVAQVFLKDPQIDPMIPGEKLTDMVHTLGAARIRFELGVQDGHGNNIVIPDFKGIAPEEEHELNVARHIQSMDELVAATKPGLDEFESVPMKKKTKGG